MKPNKGVKIVSDKLPVIESRRNGKHLEVIIYNYFENEPEKPRNIALTNVVNLFNTMLGDTLGHAPFTFATHHTTNITNSLNMKGMEKIETWEDYFTKVKESDFLTGKATKFKADYFFLMKPDVISKTMCGSYDNREEKKGVSRANITRAILEGHRSSKTCDFLNEEEIEFISNNGGLLTLGSMSKFDFNKLFT